MNDNQKRLKQRAVQAAEEALYKQKYVVVEFSRTRKRYERQGILVEKEALRKARQELIIDDDSDELPF